MSGCGANTVDPILITVNRAQLLRFSHSSHSVLSVAIFFDFLDPDRLRRFNSQLNTRSSQPPTWFAAVAPVGKGSNLPQKTGALEAPAAHSPWSRLPNDVLDSPSLKLSWLSRSLGVILELLQWL